MGELLTGVNWVAVAVGAVVSFLAGWAWYSEKMFGKKWAEGVGVQLGSAEAMPKEAMIFQFLGFLIFN